MELVGRGLKPMPHVNVKGIVIRAGGLQLQKKSLCVANPPSFPLVIVRFVRHAAGVGYDTMSERAPSPRVPEPQDSRSDHMHSPCLLRITDAFTQKIMVANYAWFLGNGLFGRTLGPNGEGQGWD